MPKINLSGMTVEALMDLREQVDETLLKPHAPAHSSVGLSLKHSWRGLAAQGLLEAVEAD
jgi:hypothetical protein